jgi:hypothetical protein
MQVSDQLVNQMLRNLPQEQQGIMAGILTNEYTHEVLCLGEDHPKSDRLIAYITQNLQVVPLKHEVDGQPHMYLRASRRRTDGEFGFECWCGQDSRLAANEQGILGADQPSKEDLYAMAANLEQNPPQYATMNGERPVDGFNIKEVRK